VTTDSNMKAHGLLWEAYSRPASLSQALVLGVRGICGLPVVPGSGLPHVDTLAAHMVRIFEQVVQEHGWRQVPLQRNFTQRRRNMGHSQLGQLVWHWTGGTGDAVRLGKYWNGGERQASSHAGVDEHGICWYLHPLWSAWHVPGHNGWTIGVDVCAPPLLTQAGAAQARGIHVGEHGNRWLRLDPRIAAAAGEFRRACDIMFPSRLSPTTHRWLAPRSRPTELLPWELTLQQAGALDTVSPEGALIT
jgi:hypothetical protein